MKLTGHSTRHPEEEASKLVLWEPDRVVQNVGRTAVAYIDNLKEDTGLATTEEIRTAAMNRARADLELEKTVQSLPLPFALKNFLV